MSTRVVRLGNRRVDFISEWHHSVNLTRGGFMAVQKLTKREVELLSGGLDTMVAVRKRRFNAESNSAIRDIITTEIREIENTRSRINGSGVQLVIE